MPVVQACGRPLRPPLRRYLQIATLRRRLGGGSLRNSPPPWHRSQASSRYSSVEKSTHPGSAPRNRTAPLQKSSSELQDSSRLEQSLSAALKGVFPAQNSLLSPVYIPEDPDAVLGSTHPAASILSNSAIVVQRQLEMMNVMLGFEEANRYAILSPSGEHLGYLAEQEHGMGNMVARQWLRTHRAFTTHVFDRTMREVLRFHRPYSVISSRIQVRDAVEPDVKRRSKATSVQEVNEGAIVDHDATNSRLSQLATDEMRLIGEAQQVWRPLRRRYDLFMRRDGPEKQDRFDQFAYVDEPFLSWDFSLLSEGQRLMGSVNRNFAGFGRELFTDTGVYALRMDAAALADEPSHMISQTGRTAQMASGIDGSKMGMTLAQRAVMLATAVSIDFDYFSRTRGGLFPGFWGWSGAGEATGAEAGTAGTAGADTAGGAVGQAGSGALGGVARGGNGAVGTSEGAMAGAGTMAGYEAMQRARQGYEDAPPPPTVSDQNTDNSPQTEQEEVWEEDWGGDDDGGDDGDFF